MAANDEPLKAKFPRMDQEKFARGELLVYGHDEKDPLIVCRIENREMLFRMPEKYVVDYVIAEDGYLYVGSKHWMLAGPSRRGTEELRGGGKVRAAGEMMRVEGQIVFNLASGTYQPTPERAAIVQQKLAEFKLDSLFLKGGQWPPQGEALLKA